ncbi:cysteine desulfurase [Candidatus Saccharibacteria bacterium]|nr:cysteine desulfurase [Candidatus Saccharibacteria bacterium]
MLYFDTSATAPLLPEVRDEMLGLMNLSVDRKLGNASSLHTAGSRAKFLLNEARSKVAQLIEARPLSIIFTSSGSESNNTVIRTFENCPIFVSAIEHPSVLKPAETYGAPCTKIPVNRQGIIDLTFLKTELKKTIAEDPKQKILVSVQLANNEIGTLEPVAKISALIKQIKQETKAKIYLHTDATQAVGKIPVSIKDLGVDYLTFTAHKLGGPVGIAALYIRPGSPFKPLILGGAQENKRRAGTSNVLLASAFGIACEIAQKNLAEYKKVEELRNYLAREIKNKIPLAIIITPVSMDASGENVFRRGFNPLPKTEETYIPDGTEKAAKLAFSASQWNDVPAGLRQTSTKTFDRKRASDYARLQAIETECEATALPNILNVSFPAAEGESTQLYLDLEGIEVSTGSACASGDLEPSHVLMATHHDAEIAHGSVRFSLGLATTKQEINELLAKLPPIIAKIQDLSTLNKEKS